MSSLAYFISPHGFGHAARASAVMAEVVRRRPGTRFELYTEVPRWFFSESLSPCFTYHRLASDVGLVQRSPLEEDLEATVIKLDAALLVNPRAIEDLVEELRRLGCRMVIADISPLGIAVADRLGMPSVLIENFTWDWIYAGYPEAPQDLLRHGLEMAEIFTRADLRIQTEPVCHPTADATRVPPVARVPRSARAEVRRLLEVPEGDSMVLLSMGGIRWDYVLPGELENQDRAWVVVPGGSRTVERRGRLILLPFHAGIYHPDLVCAADLVVGKLGYSTVAEVFLAGVAYAYVARSRFPESPILADWIDRHMTATEIDEATFRRGDWLPQMERLLNAPRCCHENENGAEAAANVILDLLSR